ncbi:MAG: hybrid sensor histidine kinase/response regulator [Sphingobacteriia bacterium]|nr:MAG: hybrid sensor histidine kinase/response regulator [Sphingobacteriia bacterium]
MQSGNENFLILLVDDRPENIISLEEILDKPGRSFLKANSGNEALKMVLKNEAIGLIMLDVQMPDMDGFEVARILKSTPKTKDLSIVFVTAISKEEQYVLKGFEEGAVDYLQKPLDINITRAKVNVFERLYHAQKAVRNSLAEIERVNKQLERFVFIVSHDLKSPLATIGMLADLIRKDELVQKEKELTENATIIYEVTHKLSGMIESILDYSRKSQSEQTIESVDIQQLVTEIIRLFSLPDKYTIKVEGVLPTIQTKKIKLQQVIQNLISNSIKYNEKSLPEITLGAEDKGDYLVFFVKDNGQGIAKKDQEKIFKLFEVTENTSKHDSSTGVGLNLLKVLVEEQGGKIWVDSEPGIGSTFYFEWRK